VRGANGEGQFSEGQTAEGQLAEGQLSEGQTAEGQSVRGNRRGAIVLLPNLGPSRNQLSGRLTVKSG
jgi:hypothetical protein